EASLENIDDVLQHIRSYKKASTVRLQQKLKQYNGSVDVETDVAKLAKFSSAIATKFILFA
ncbi:hypothetical protein OY671_005865, partial [Metschnikowia pulcherrima]